MATKSRDAIDGDTVTLRKGLAVYRLNKSPNYRARVWDARAKKYIIKSTRTSSLVEAKIIAEEMAAAVHGSKPIDDVLNPNSITKKGNPNGNFVSLADELIEREREKGERGECHRKLYKNTSFYLHHNDWGACSYFKTDHVTEIQTPQYLKYMDWVRSKDKTLRPATMNHIATNISKVLKMGRDFGFITTVPDTPRVRRNDNPRAYFKFVPIVEREKDEYKLLLATANRMAAERMKVRETIIDGELLDMIMFLAHSFLRPTASEFYGVRHRDVSIQTDPKSLQIIIPKGKTGSRIVNTMAAGVSVYERILKRNTEYLKPDDYLFFAKYPNRTNAIRIAQRIFYACLEEAGLKDDTNTGAKHTLYSLRHTAISMRIVLSKGKTNIYTLAKNAGTSVNQIERFYAAKLPMEAELVRNLQSFGE